MAASKFKLLIGKKTVHFLANKYMKHVYCLTDLTDLTTVWRILQMIVKQLGHDLITLLNNEMSKEFLTGNYWTKMDGHEEVTAIRTAAKRNKRWQLLCTKMVSASSQRS